MNYCFTTLTTTILCLFLVIFTGESHAQYNSAYDKKVKSLEQRVYDAGRERRRYEESENNRNKILNSTLLEEEKR
ncbi:MAG: hypothetical protein ABI325_01425 [Ginsengibacter sp.]